MFYCVSIMMLGYTRINGVVAYDSESKGFEELTPAVARQLIAKNMIKGIKWKNSEGNSGEFICDLRVGISRTFQSGLHVVSLDPCWMTCLGCQSTACTR